MFRVLRSSTHITYIGGKKVFSLVERGTQNAMCRGDTLKVMDATNLPDMVVMF